MAISPVDLNYAMTRTQDYASSKQNQDVKGMVDQTNFQQHIEKEVNQRLTHVRQKDNADKENHKFDAKEKGKNEYMGNGGQNRQKQNNEQQGEKVVIKGMSRFDVQI